MSDTSEIPELDAKEFESIGALMACISLGAVKLPVWIRFRKTRHKITTENADGVCKGLLIAMEFQEMRK